MSKDWDYDIFISGAGMVGCSLALGLASTGLKIAIIDATQLKQSDKTTFDERGITLSLASKRIFENLGLWQALQSSSYPIKQVHISEQNRFAFTRLRANEMNVDALGYVVIASTLGNGLRKSLSQHDNIEFICPAELKSFELTQQGMRVTWQQEGSERSARAGLLIGADGSCSLTRRLAGINTEQHDFKQTAIVANVSTEKRNQYTAYERFTPHGPIALLPVAENRSVLVYVVNSEDADYCLSLDDPQFLARVQSETGRRLGRLITVGVRRSYPIFYQNAVRQYQPQLLLLGNAVHTIHPNSAQGFNLGLRDVAGLAEVIKQSLVNGLTLDDVRILERYVDNRTEDQKRIINFTNGLAEHFYHQQIVSNLLRDVAMIGIDSLPF